MSARSLRGDVVLLDFWSTACGPCRKTTPFMQALYKRYRARGFKIVGVSLDDPTTVDQVRPFVKSVGVTYPVSARIRGNFKMAERYHVAVYPSVILVDRKGVVRWSQGGYYEGEEPDIKANVKKLLAE